MIYKMYPLDYSILDRAYSIHEYFGPETLNVIKFSTWKTRERLQFRTKSGELLDI